MIEYFVLASSSNATLTDEINELAAEGWIVSQFSISNGGHYGNNQIYSVIMEREKP